MTLKAFKVSNSKIDKNDGNKANIMAIDLFKFNRSKNNNFEKLTYILNIKVIEKAIFLILNAKKTLNYLKHIFIKALIF